MPQHIRIAQKLAEVRVLIGQVEAQLDKDDAMDDNQRDEWLDRLLDLKDMEKELTDMYTS